MKIIVFTHNESPGLDDIYYYINKYHRCTDIEFLSIDDIFNHIIYKNIISEISNYRYAFFYITTDNRKIRSKIRNFIKYECEKDIHIKKYSKLVGYVKQMSMWKG
jgi:hypothetical protein